MGFKGWPEENIVTDTGEQVKTKSPLIISASRGTDIPAFYSEWFFNRLKKNYLKWINPFNGKPSYISFSNTSVVVFWSKNPAPVFPYLPILDKLNIGYYFLITLNDYEQEQFEPNVPPLAERIATFKNLSKKIGKEKVIWRYDPLMKASTLDIKELIRRIEEIGNAIHPYTEKMVFSFVQIGRYKKVQQKLLKETNQFDKNNLLQAEFSKAEKTETIKELNSLTQNWGIQLASCAEEDLTNYCIQPNKCIDDDLMRRLFSHDDKLINFLNTGDTQYPEQNTLFGDKPTNFEFLKDKGQRAACRCIYSKDIGQYNTCPHLCKYCYANVSRESTLKNFRKHDPENESIC
jgi:DNA repair photolyase